MKEVWRSIKNEWNEYNEGEILVRELTKNDDIPPSKQELEKLNDFTKDSMKAPSIYQMLNKRLHDVEYLAHIEKALIVVEYLLKNSDTRFIRYMKMQTDFIKRLRKLKYNVTIDSFTTEEKGGNVRRRADRIYILLTDDEELEKQRCKAQGKPYVPKTKSSNDDNKQTSKQSSKSKKDANKTDTTSEKKQKQEIKDDDKQNQDKDKKSQQASNKQQSKTKQNQTQNQQQDLFDTFDFE